MTRIVFLDRNTIGPGVELTRPSAPHDWEAFGATSPEQTAQRLQGAQIALTNKTPLRRDVLEQCPSLKFIAITATGYDVVDVEACRELGIAVSNVRGYAVNSVPEHTMALILALRRAIPGYQRDVIEGAWGASGQFCFFTHPISDLAGSKIGVIGAGAIGRSVAKLAEAFGMEVMFAARKGAQDVQAPYTPFDQMLREADVITAHAPLTPETRGLISRDEFQQMKRKPLIINTSRGGLVDEAAAVEALESGLIGGLGFDVLTSEPPADDNPILRVAARPDVILTPHVAWASTQAMQTLWGQVVENVDAYLKGAPIRLVV